MGTLLDLKDGDCRIQGHSDPWATGLGRFLLVLSFPWWPTPCSLLSALEDRPPGAGPWALPRSYFLSIL